MHEYINITLDNIEQEHLCCAIGDPKHQPKFNENARKMGIDSKDFTIYYSPECPYTANCINEITTYAT